MTSSSSNPSLVLFVLGALLLVCLHSTLSAREKRKKYPPGPPPKFLIGNLLDLPGKRLGQTYLEHGRRLGSDIVHVSALGNHVIVANTREVAEELLEKRARNSSGRPWFAMTKMLDWEYNIAAMDYGDEWRKHRKVCQQHFNRVAAKSFQPIQLQKTRRMLVGLLRFPEKFMLHNRMHSLSISMDFLFGYQIDTLDDPAILAANKSLDIGNPLFTVNGSLITVFPFLARVPAWVPGAISQKRAAEGRYWTHEMKRIPLEDVRRRMDEGRATPSLVSQLLEKKNTVGIADEDEQIMNNVAFTVYGAASDTTISVTNTFFYAMSLHPEVQAKAQAEIDRIVGTHRLPEFSDRSSMPYIEAIYREVMRYGPPVPLGVMHTLAEDDYYREYFLPKGERVFANIWAMTHDENVYKDPDTFNPDRFLTEDGELNDDDRVLAYGFGRRICVGKHVASSTTWITIVSLLACINIGKAKDEFGNEIEVNREYDDDGLLVHKQPFKCSIVPRSEVARKLIEEAALN